MKVTTAVINKFRHFGTNFALDIFDIFVVFRHVVTKLDIIDINERILSRTNTIGHSYEII